MSLRLLILFILLGCGKVPISTNNNLNDPVDMTLKEAQEFHKLISEIGHKNGFECNIEGFPVWSRGLTPNVGELGEWIFSDPDLHTIGLKIKVEAKNLATNYRVLFYWKEFKITILYEDFIEFEIGTTNTLINSLKELNEKS